MRTDEQMNTDMHQFTRAYLKKNTFRFWTGILTPKAIGSAMVLGITAARYPKEDGTPGYDVRFGDVLDAFTDELSNKLLESGRMTGSSAILAQQDRNEVALLLNSVLYELSRTSVWEEA